jgi:heme-degrading monooxygenase HmoA
MAGNISIALSGNPNAGKTTLFNAITGARQHTGNWPGVTVEKKEVRVMFVVLINFPPIKEGKDTKFREWFVSTNEEFSKFKGFIRRRLLKPLGEGNYAAVVEFENQDTFKSTSSSPAHDTAAEHVKALFDGNPTPHFYQVAIG